MTSVGKAPKSTPVLPATLTREERKMVRTALGHNPLLKLLAPADLDKLAGAAALVTVAEGAPIFKEGERANSIMLVLKGGGTRWKDGVEKMAKVTAGQLLGMHALSGAEKREDTYIADAPTLVVEIGLGGLMRMLPNNPVFARSIELEKNARPQQK